MRNKDKSTYRKIEFRRKESFYLLVRGLEVGIVSGLIAVLYRFLLSLAENYLMKIISYVKGNPVKIAVWFVILALIGFFVSMLVKWEPQGGGSGIPQVSGEIKGHINPSWWRVILVKLIGGTASVFSGLSLGREGPSVQLGGMAAKGIARLTKADKTTELRMISCGAGAGMAAAFNAPLAGTMFVLEEIHHTFDKSLLCMGIVSAVTADYISKLFFGQNTVFNYDTVNFPLKYYWLLLIMGVFLGLCGSAYNVVMGKAQDLYKKIKAPNYIKMPIIFVFSGVVGLIMPQILCGGHSSLGSLFGAGLAGGLLGGLNNLSGGFGNRLIGRSLHGVNNLGSNFGSSLGSGVNGLGSAFSGSLHFSLCFSGGSLGAGLGLAGHFVDGPVLVIAVHIGPDLQDCTVFGVHVDQVQALAGQVGLDLYAAIIGGLHDPQLAGSVSAFPLVNMGAIGHAGAIQVHHLAGETVLDAVHALAGAHKAPLLPFGVGIIPQLDLSAVLGVVILYFNNLAVCSGDGIKLILSNNGLSNFLGSHV